MTRASSLLLVALTLMPGVASAQDRGAIGERHQVSVDVGVYALGLSYARRIRSSDWSAGAGVWGAWEPPHSWERSVFEPIGFFVFGRYRPAAWVHADVGATAARYLWTDDCSDCTGSFVGARGLLLVGHRFVFLGPDLSLGVASDERNGSEFGAIWGVQLRLAFGWGS